MSAGEFLKKMRNQHGLSIKDVSERSNGLLDRTTISRIERGNRSISLKAAYAFAQIYNISMEMITEQVVKDRIDSGRMPFDTSDEERALIETYRLLPNERKNIVFDIIWGLAEFNIKSSSYDSRERVIQALYDLKN